MLHTLIQDEFKLWESISEKKFTNNRFKLTINPDQRESSSGFFNLAIPTDNNFTYTEKELAQLQDIFIEQGSLGNFITSALTNNPRLKVEESCYLYRESPLSHCAENKNLKVVKTTDYYHFAKIVQEGFEYDINFVESFHQRMKFVTQMLESHFYILENNQGEALSCCSYFRNSKDNFFYLMNSCTLPIHREKGFTSYLINKTQEFLSSGVYARTNNPVMISALKKAEFIKSETFFIKKL